MFRRLYTTFFRYAQQAAPRFSGEGPRNRYLWLTGLLGAQIGAATVVGPTDEELAKKPKWYKNAVYDLERAIQETNRYEFLEKKKTIEEARRILLKFKNQNNPEILWRLSRVYAEKAELLPKGAEKERLLREAYEYGKKALFYEKKPIGDLHKWYGIALIKLMQFDKKLRKSCKTVAREHFEKAVQLNPNDPYAWQLLGSEKLNHKEYKEALYCFEKAEELMPNFSSANHYFVGRACMLMKQKERAIEELKLVFKLPLRSNNDLLARIEARKCLAKYGVDRQEFDPKSEQ